MADVIIVDNKYITIKFLPDKKMIHHTVHQPISGQNLRDALTAGFNALQHYGVSKWLSDDRKNGPMSDEDRDWGAENINRRSLEAGWKYWALVVPQALVAAGSMVPTIEAMFDLGLRMMVFSTVEEAFEWLDQFDD
ncbi:MAG: hypothetical protein HY866_07890 [Chloroflexi bacterium]|nr:hypothetical protein [Chloroflexota bacterium]